MTAKEAASAELHNLVAALRGLIEAADDGVLITKDTRDGEGVTAKSAKEIVHKAIQLLTRQHQTIHKGVRFVKIAAAGEKLYAMDERGHVFEYGQCAEAEGCAVDYGWQRVSGDDNRDPRPRT